MFFFQAFHALRGHHVCHRAAGTLFGQQDGFVRAQYFGGFSHKFHAAENDHISVCILCFPAQVKRIPDKVGNVLNLGPLVIMR